MCCLQILEQAGLSPAEIRRLERLRRSYDGVLEKGLEEFSDRELRRLEFVRWLVWRGELEV